MRWTLVHSCYVHRNLCINSVVEFGKKKPHKTTQSMFICSTEDSNCKGVLHVEKSIDYLPLSFLRCSTCGGCVGHFLSLIFLPIKLEQNGDRSCVHNLMLTVCANSSYNCTEISLKLLGLTRASFVLQWQLWCQRELFLLHVKAVVPTLNTVALKRPPRVYASAKPSLPWESRQHMSEPHASHSSVISSPLLQSTRPHVSVCCSYLRWGQPKLCEKQEYNRCCQVEGVFKLTQTELHTCLFGSPG